MNKTKTEKSKEQKIRSPKQQEKKKRPRDENGTKEEPEAKKPVDKLAEDVLTELRAKKVKLEPQNNQTMPPATEDPVPKKAKLEFSRN